MDVLFIEDDPECRVSIMGIFSEYLPDFNVTVDSGSECIHVIINRNPDLVVLSLDILGLDVMKMIEKTRIFSDVPIIVLSTKGCSELTAALEIGASSCMRKPVNDREFIARVKALLRG